MARQIKQIRFYSDGSAENYPASLTRENLYIGQIFFKYKPIIQLGIQAAPGSKFYLGDSNNPIIIGSTGIYELNVENLTEISDLGFDPETLDMINDNNALHIIVDILYEANEGGN